MLATQRIHIPYHRERGLETEWSRDEKDRYGSNFTTRARLRATTRVDTVPESPRDVCLAHTISHRFDPDSTGRTEGFSGIDFVAFVTLGVLCAAHSASTDPFDTVLLETGRELRSDLGVRSRRVFFSKKRAGETATTFELSKEKSRRPHAQSPPTLSLSLSLKIQSGAGGLLGCCFVWLIQSPQRRPFSTR